MRTVIFCCLLWPVTVYAEVLDVNDHGFTSEHRIELSGTPAEAYIALTRDIHLWWDANHSYGGQASTFTLKPVPGGCFCEGLADGGFVEHMRVVNAQTGKSLTMQGGLGPLQSMGVSGSMSFSFAPQGEGTVLTYRYVVGGYTAGGLEPLAGPVDQVQLAQLKRLQKYLASGEPLN